MFVPEDRQKILNSLIMKNMVFGELSNEKKHELITHILENTDRYTEFDLQKLIELCVNEYQKRKSDYHKQSLIQKDFIMDKIQELRSEEKRKGNN